MFIENQISWMVHFFLILVLTISALGTLTTESVFAATLTVIVINTNDSGVCSLRQAIASASSGDTITFHPLPRHESSWKEK